MSSTKRLLILFSFIFKDHSMFFRILVHAGLSLLSHCDGFPSGKPSWAPGCPLSGAYRRAHLQISWCFHKCGQPGRRQNERKDTHKHLLVILNVSNKISATKPMGISSSPFDNFQLHFLFSFIDRKWLKKSWTPPLPNLSRLLSTR